MSDWVDNELNGLDLGDERLERRAHSVLETLARNPRSSLLKAFQAKAELAGVYRLLGNERVEGADFAAQHGRSTLERMGGFERVLCLSDTTFVAYPNREPIEGLGPFNRLKDNGFFMHVDFAVSEEGVCLGTLNWQSFVRDKALDKRKTQARRPVSEKENQRWVDSYAAVDAAQHSLSAQGRGTRLTFITDREGDFYELLERASAGSADFLIRAQSTRLLPQGTRIGERPHQLAPLGRLRFDLPARRGVKARSVTQTLYSQRVGISARRGKARTKPVEVTVLWVCEDAAPKGQQPLNWILMSNLPVDDMEQAQRLVRWYCLRWRVEMLFDVLKNTCQVERLQLRSAEGIQKLCALYLIVSWRILYLMTLSREHPQLDALTCFTSEELKVLTATQVLWSRKQLPPPKTLGQAVLFLARIGGYLARKNEGPPGHRTLTFALMRLIDFATLHRALGS